MDTDRGSPNILPLYFIAQKFDFVQCLICIKIEYSILFPSLLYLLYHINFIKHKNILTKHVKVFYIFLLFFIIISTIKAFVNTFS